MPTLVLMIFCAVVIGPRWRLSDQILTNAPQMIRDDSRLVNPRMIRDDPRLVRARRSAKIRGS
jgi:hypothetical protein